MAPVVGEAQPVGLFGVAGDGEGAVVVEAVVVGTQAAQVAAVGVAKVVDADEHSGLDHVDRAAGAVVAEAFRSRSALAASSARSRSSRSRSNSRYSVRPAILASSITGC